MSKGHRLLDLLMETHCVYCEARTEFSLQSDSRQAQKCKSERLCVSLPFLGLHLAQRARDLRVSQFDGFTGIIWNRHMVTQAAGGSEKPLG